MNAPQRASLVAERLAAIRELLARRDATAALLSSRANFAWATVGGENHVVLSSESGVAGLLVTRDAAWVITAVNEAPRIADEELRGTGLTVVDVPWHDPDAMASEAERLAATAALDDAALEDAIRPHRSVLTDVEVERMRWLGARAGAAVAVALGSAEAGQTEHEIAGRVLADAAAGGIRLPVLLAAADDRIARYRHPLPTERRIERRIMVVAVAERWGLHVALTRFAELEPLDADLRRRLEAAQAVHAAMVDATRPGSTLGEVLGVARRAYAEAGFPDEWKLHHQGGSIGYQGREQIAVPGDSTPIRAGMAFAWNPSVAGAKTEETIVCDAVGVESVTA